MNFLGQLKTISNIIQKIMSDNDINSSLKFSALQLLNELIRELERELEKKNLSDLEDQQKIFSHSLMESQIPSSNIRIPPFNMGEPKCPVCNQFTLCRKSFEERNILICDNCNYEWEINLILRRK